MATSEQTAPTDAARPRTSTDDVHDTDYDVRRRDAAASRLWDHLKEVLDEAAVHAERTRAEHGPRAADPRRQRGR